YATLHCTQANDEIYDPTSGMRPPTTTLYTYTTLFRSPTATLLPNGKVLVVGGYNSGIVVSAELYDPAGGKWTVTGSLNTPRWEHTSALLPNVKVLVAGGRCLVNVVLASAELYEPASGI